MKSNVIAAVAGGLVLGAAVFVPLGANAINQEIKQVSTSQEKVEAPTKIVADEPQTSNDDLAQTAAIDPVVTPDPTVTPDPIAVTGPTFSSGDDDESDDVNDDESDDVNETESDD